MLRCLFGRGVAATYRAAASRERRRNSEDAPRTLGKLNQSAGFERLIGLDDALEVDFRAPVAAI